MSKKRKKSRFTKTDVNTICEMQRKIDAYEDFIVTLCGMVQRRNPKYQFICLKKGTEIDDFMGELWLNCKDLIRYWDGHKPKIDDFMASKK